MKNTKWNSEYEYGLSDNVQFIFETVFEHHAGGDTDLHNIAIGGKYKFTDSHDYFLGSALQLTYGIGTAPGVANEIEAELIVEKSIGDVTVRSNVQWLNEIGQDSHGEDEIEFRLGTYKSFGHDMTLGLEYYAVLGELGETGGYEEQKHYIGPRLGWGYELPHHRRLGFEFGYFAGISHAAEDATILLRTKFEF